MRTWPWLMSFFLFYGMFAQAQTNPVVPADDRKEPKTLSKVVSEAKPTKPAPDLLDEPQALKAETTYNPFATLALPKPEVLAIKSGPVKEKVGTTQVLGYQAAPEKKAPEAEILLLPEWWGLNDQIKSEADYWARKGYKVLAVDLYRGKVAQNRGEAARLMSQLKIDEVMPQVKAALDLLTAPAADQATTVTTATTAKRPAAVMGFGIGATYAQRLAAEDARLAGLIIIHGDLIKDAAELGKIKAPTLGIFARNDAWLTSDKIEAFKKALSGAKLPPQTFTFDTGAGFMFNTGDPTDKGYAETAHTRIADFLKRELGS